MNEKFLDLDVKPFFNKNNKQVSIALPKKMLGDDFFKKNQTKLKIRIFR